MSTPDVPGVPTRHRKMHSAEEIVLPPAPPPVPKAPRLPTMNPKGSMLKEYGALIAAVFAGLTGLAGVFKPPPESATSKETQELRVETQHLREEVATARTEFAKANIAGLGDKLDAWQTKQNQESAKGVIRDKRDELLAQAVAVLNGGPPVRNWPEPDSRWIESLRPPPLHRTDQQWPEMPSDK